jgi:diguanylate cyclase (GGDEF)-like protein
MRVALVEPSRTVRRIVAEMIASEHDIVAASDGPEAVTLLNSNRDVRALITSAELPSLSGAALVAQVRALAGSRRPLYIILMSSNDERGKRVEALEKGADDFISKPPAPEELRARLRAAERMTSMQAELIRHATLDSLTGLLTRRAFFEAAGAMFKSVTAGQPLSAVICDIDKFKAVNDTYGHAAGDLVLRTFGQQADQIGVPVGRLGGEEIAFLVAEPLNQAVGFAEQFKASVAALPIYTGTQTIRVSCSIGVAEWESGDTIDTLLHRADVALYKAKQGGRNCVVAALENSSDASPELADAVTRIRGRV